MSRSDSKRLSMVLLAVCLAASGSSALATSAQYRLDLPAQRTLGYQIEFEVAHPGVVAIDAEWSPSRVLVFRLERPGEPTFRRSGPSPQRIEIEVDPDELATDALWTLSISGLPSRTAAEGRLVIEFPETPEERERLAPPPPPEPEPDPWTVAVEAPRDLGPDRRRVFEATERFRALVVGAEFPDTYRWQDAMLAYLADRRDRAATQRAVVGAPSKRMFRRVADVVRRLDLLRRVDSEPLAGPAPVNPVSRRAWRSVRDPRFAPVVDELDSLLDDLNDGHCPELEREGWFDSFLSCLIICERHFEERALLGDDWAENAALVRSQWGPVLAAANALDALADVP